VFVQRYNHFESSIALGLNHEYFMLSNLSPFTFWNALVLDTMLCCAHLSNHITVDESTHLAHIRHGRRKSAAKNLLVLIV